MSEKFSERMPRCVLPTNATDCHVHILDRDARKTSHLPSLASVDASVAMYKRLQSQLGLQRMVIVQSNAYQMDNRVLLDALKYFAHNARGVASVNAATSNAELESLHTAGVRGARIMNLMNGPVGLDQMLSVNERTHRLGWNMIVQFNGREIMASLPLFEAIKGDFVIDHVGKFMPPVKPDSEAFNTLLSLLDRGNCYVKVAGFYEFSAQGSPLYDDVGVLVRALVKHAPERVIWGSNWPHLMAKTESQCPDDMQLLDLVGEWLGGESQIKQVFVDNPARLYGFES